MSGKVVVKHAFGMNPKLKNCLSIVEDHQIAYVCGHQVVIMNNESKEQCFISGSVQQYQSSGISGVVGCPSKKMIAVAEIVEPCGIVTIYDAQSLKRKKTLHHNELGSKEIRCMAFSPDGKYCITQGAGPEWMLVLWNVEKSSKLIATTKISLTDDNYVNQVSFCPWDNSIICCVGKGIIRIFRVADGYFRPLNINIRRDHVNILCHTWLMDEKLLLGTDMGEIILLEGFEFRAVIYPVNNNNNNFDKSIDIHEIQPILSMHPISKGFVCGTVHGELWLFVNDEETKEQFRREDIYTLPSMDTGSIISIVVTADDTLVCATDSQQLYSFVLSNTTTTTTHALKEKDAQHASGNSSGFDYLFTSFHSPNQMGESGINAVDIAMWKPIAATCGKDKTVRIWNITDRKSEIIKQYTEEPIAISLHPSGLYIIIGFQERVIMASILLDDIFLTRDLAIRGSSALKFSQGGQYFSVIIGTNISIYSTYTGNLVSNLRGHNSKVKSVTWLHLDARVMSIGSEGTVYTWDTFTGVRNTEVHLGVIPITASAAFCDGSKAYSVTNDKMLKEIPMQKTFDAATGQEVIKQMKELDVQKFISCMIVDDVNKLLFMATGENDSPGSIISATTHPVLSSNLDSIPVHNTVVTSMCLNHQGTLIFSVDNDGCFIVSEIDFFIGQKPQNATTKLRTEGSVTYDFIDEILIKKSDLDARRNKINELTLRVEELTLNCEHHLRLKEMEHKDRIHDITAKFQGKLSSESENFINNLTDKKNTEKEYMSQLEALEEHQKKELNQIESRYKLKLSVEATRYSELDNNITNALKKWNNENKTLVESHQNYLRTLTEEYERKLDGEHQLQRQLQKEKSVIQEEFESTRVHTELDTDKEIDDMTSQYDNRLKSEEDASIVLMAEHAVSKKALQMLTRDSDLQKDEIKKMKEREVRLIETIRSLEKDIQSHKKEIREREETITDKEKRIFDLKKKNQELEKFRFVLDYKIKELKLQIAPRENEITQMQRQIEDMDLELEQYHKSNQALTLMIGELKLKLEGLRKELLSQTSRVEISSKLLEKFMRDLQDVYLVRNDYHALKERIVSLYRMYVQEDVLAREIAAGFANGEKGGDPTGTDTGPQRQYNRDREQMERSLDGLRRSLHTDAEMHKRDLAKMLRENVMLTSEMNDLRKNAQKLHLQKSGLEQAIEAGPKSDISEMVDLLGLSLAGKSNEDEEEAKLKKTKSSTALGQTQGGLPPAQSTGALLTNKMKNTLMRSTALKRTSSAGMIGNKSSSSFAANNRSDDTREAIRELEMQNENILRLTSQIEVLCQSLSISSSDVLSRIEKCLL